MYRHHDFEERLNIVKRIIAGESQRAICRELGICDNLLRQWYLRYKEYGEDGLRGTKSFHYSPEEKLEIVKQYLEKGVPLQELCLRYNINRTTARTWINKVRRNEPLDNLKRGRQPKKPLA